MKKVILLGIIILCLNVSFAFGQGYGFYQENGKWGVTYNGEPCVLPRFDGVAGISGEGIFSYKKNGRCGFANVWNIISEPFCDSIARFPDQYCETTFNKGYESSIEYNSPVFYKFLDGGKWGVCTVDGCVLVPALYDEVYDKIFDNDDLDIKKKEWYKSYALLFDHYFLVKKDGACKLLNICGETVVSDIVSFDQFIAVKKDKKYKKIYKNAVKDYAKAIDADQTARNRLRSQRSKARNATMENTLFMNYVMPYSDSDMTIEQMQKPREVYFGYKNGKLEPMQGDTLIVSGLPSIVTDYGFISTPLVYDSPYFRLQRNPYDVYAYLTLMDQRKVHGRFWLDAESGYVSDEDVLDGTASYNIDLFQSNLEYYATLLEMAKETENKAAYDEVSNRIEKAKNALNAYENAVEQTQHSIERNARLDKIGNSFSSILNSMAAVVGSGQSSSSGLNVSGQRDISSGASSGSSKNGDSSATMTGADQRNYNTLRNTYNKWASDLMQMKNLNGQYQNGYEEKDKRHAQSEMKRIREMAKSKWGKEIPYNSIEDWN